MKNTLPAFLNPSLRRAIDDSVALNTLPSSGIWFVSVGELEAALVRRDGQVKFWVRGFEVENFEVEARRLASEYYGRAVVASEAKGGTWDGCPYEEVRFLPAEK